MNKDNILGALVGAVLVLTVVLLVSAFGGSERPTGASSGPDHYNLEYFLNGSVQGGDLITYTATTSESAVTMPIAWLKASQIDMAAVNGVAINLTTPSTTTLVSLLPRIGDSKTIYFRNLNAAATTTTIVAGAGVDLRISENTGADVIIAGLQNAKITFQRLSSSVVSALVEKDVVGD